MSYAKLGNLQFRIDPDQVHFAYGIDYSIIDTLGGQVIQVLGATLGDLTISGSFGQDHKNRLESWELAEGFHASIRSMIDAQTLPQQGGKGPVHQPISFTYMDGIHDWNLKVLIKDIEEGTGQGSIEHKTGKFSYHYTLTLFIVEDSSLKLKKIATDKFISRIANGLGWKPSGYNGAMSLQDAITWITNNSSDGTVQGYLTKLLDQAAGQ